MFAGKLHHPVPDYNNQSFDIILDLELHDDACPIARAQGSNVFAGKHGFITPRDLFRWAGRGAVGYQQVLLSQPESF